MNALQREVIPKSPFRLGGVAFLGYFFGDAKK